MVPKRQQVKEELLLCNILNKNMSRGERNHIMGQQQQHWSV
jgi:hypothetical protein